MKRVVMLLMIGLLAVQAQALYVDATPGVGGNTVQASDGDVDAWWINATASDGIWGYRAFGLDANGDLNGASIYEASGTGSGSEDCMTILTKASGLTAGQLYQVEVVYWSSNSQNWNVRAGFDTESMILFDRIGDTEIGATAGTEVEGILDGDRILLKGVVGTIAADDLGQISVCIDDLPGGGWYDRTWYEGIELTAVPEPITMVLLGLGTLILRRRR